MISKVLIYRVCRTLIYLATFLALYFPFKCTWEENVGNHWKTIEKTFRTNTTNRVGETYKCLGNTSRLSQELSACRLFLSFRMYAPAFKAIRSRRSFASKLINLQNSSSGLLALSTFCFRRFWRRLYLNSLPFLLYNCPAKLMKPMWWCAHSNGSSAWKPLPLNYVKQILNK